MLVAIQTGIYLGSERKISAIIDQAPADLWVVPLGTKSYDDPSLLTGRERHMILSTRGVASAEDMVVSFARWRKPAGGTTAILLVGTGADSSYALPWNIENGSRAALEAPNTVAIDQSYFPDLGISGLGDRAEINGISIEIAATTKRIRSFTTLPYVFASIEEARRLTGTNEAQSTYIRVGLEPGSDLESVRSEITARLPDTEVLTNDEFKKRSQAYWLFQTGAGAALIAGALLGLIVGIVIVAQTLYASTKDHINEFATLRALGGGRLHREGDPAAGGPLGCHRLPARHQPRLRVIQAAQDTKLNVIMTPELATGLFAVTVGMCVFAAISAIVKVVRIDPAVVFSR